MKQKEVNIELEQKHTVNPIPGTLFKTKKGHYRTVNYWHKPDGSIDIEFQTADKGKPKILTIIPLEEWFRLAKEGFIEVVEL